MLSQNSDFENVPPRRQRRQHQNSRKVDELPKANSSELTKEVKELPKAKSNELTKTDSRRRPGPDYEVDAYGKRLGKNGKPLGRPTHNLEYVLTPFQISLIVAFLLTDGWLAKGDKFTNPSVGLQICERNKELVDYFVKELQDFVTAKPLRRMKPAPGSGDKLFPQYQIRTVAHPQFQQFIQAFGGHGTNKKVPSVSYLMQVLKGAGEGTA